MLATCHSPPLSATRPTIGQHALPNNYMSPRSRANTSSPRPHLKQALPTSPQLRLPPSPSAKHAPESAPPKPQNVDTGTQYTPPDWPPTSLRSSLRRVPDTDLAPASAPADASSITANPATEVGVPTIEKSSTNRTTQNVADHITDAPAELQARVIPQTALSTGPGPSRRTRSTVSSSPPVSPSSKRKRAQNPDAKVLPVDYAQCDGKQLASIIADMLMELIRFNDEIPLGNSHLTRFHSRAPPGISVHDYLARLTFHATLSPPILLSMVYYIDKLCALYTPFTINSLTVHRFLITAATVASKGLSDSFWTNSTYARVGGVSLKELALLELEFLTRVQWKILPSPEALVDYYRHLVGRSAHFVIEGWEEVEDDDEDSSKTGTTDVDEDVVVKMETASVVDTGEGQEGRAPSRAMDLMDTSSVSASTSER